MHQYHQGSPQDDASFWQTQTAITKSKFSARKWWNYHRSLIALAFYLRQNCYYHYVCLCCR
jgi:hypothetical protein